jgi:hypothetical protein
MGSIFVCRFLFEFNVHPYAPLARGHLLLLESSVMSIVPLFFKFSQYIARLTYDAAGKAQVQHWVNGCEHGRSKAISHFSFSFFVSVRGGVISGLGNCCEKVSETLRMAYA